MAPETPNSKPITKQEDTRGFEAPPGLKPEIANNLSESSTNRNVLGSAIAEETEGKKEHVIPLLKGLYLKGDLDEFQRKMPEAAKKDPVGFLEFYFRHLFLPLPGIHQEAGGVQKRLIDIVDSRGINIYRLFNNLSESDPKHALELLLLIPDEYGMRSSYPFTEKAIRILLKTEPEEILKIYENKPRDFGMLKPKTQEEIFTLATRKDPTLVLRTTYLLPKYDFSKKIEKEALQMMTTKDPIEFLRMVGGPSYLRDYFEYNKTLMIVGSVAELEKLIVQAAINAVKIDPETVIIYKWLYEDVPNTENIFKEAFFALAKRDGREITGVEDEDNGLMDILEEEYGSTGKRPIDSWGKRVVEIANKNW